MTDLSKSHLNIILSALEGERRNPNSKDAALKRITRHADRLGLTTDDILAAAAGLLDGRMGAEAFRAALQAADDPIAIAAGETAAEPRPGDEGSTIASDDTDPLAIPPQLRRAPVAAAVEAPAALVIPKRNGDPKPRLQRQDSKQALVIAMLRRPEGATIAEIVDATGWLAHTVRGAFAGALKKKLGLTITSEKTEGAARTYRIAE